MQIRRAKPADAKGIAEVNVASWQAAYRGVLPDSLLDALSVEDKRGRWEARIAENLEQVLVLEQDQRVVGFAAFGASRDSVADQDKAIEFYTRVLGSRSRPTFRTGPGTAGSRSPRRVAARRSRCARRRTTTSQGG